MSLSFNQKRLAVGFFLGVAILLLANYYFDFGIFGAMAKKAMILGFVALAAALHFLGPTMQELRDHKKK